MSLEIIGAWLIKLGWVGFIPYLTWSYQRDKVKLEETITKKEAGELIDLKLAPLEQKIDNQAAGLHDKFDLLLDIVRSDNEKNSIQRKDNTDMLHSINTNVAVIKNEVDNIKERMNDEHK
mgnify:CR=1 FL=1